jgi:hypothetical protein
MLNRFSYIFLLGLLALAALLYIQYARIHDEGPQRFTGVDRCRVCHEAASTGSQFKVWLNGPHAHAHKAIETDSAKALLARAGSGFTIDSCLGCHSTLGRSAGSEIETRLVTEGVGCERCHGPGSNYADYNTMMHRPEFTSHGGVVGSLRDCYQCHAASVGPGTRHCPFQRTAFNADTAWRFIKHPLVRNNDHVPDTVIQLRKQPGSTTIR